jgi:universal stress protein A
MFKMKRILMATDFSDHSKDALEYAVHLAKAFKAELHLLHIFENPYLSAAYEVRSLVQEAWEEDLETLNKMVKPIRKKRIKVYARLMDGIRFDQIVRTARELPADLIVIGTHGRTGLAHVMIGSVAERVVQRAPCPVLTVRSRTLSKSKR